MGQKHKRFLEFRTPFPLRDIRENPRSNVRACAAGDGAICSKNRKIVPYHGANPNTRNGARLRSPSPIMAPATSLYLFFFQCWWLWETTNRLKSINNKCFIYITPNCKSTWRHLQLTREKRETLYCNTCKAVKYRDSQYV